MPVYGNKHLCMHGATMSVVQLLVESGVQLHGLLVLTGAFP